MRPIRFKPLLKQALWGDGRIIPLKRLGEHLDHVGESWDISGVENDETVAINGPHAGKTVNEIVAEMKEELVGKDNYRRFGNEFPLLIKFIDACRDLSIQVHPSDEVAHRHGEKRGKTEMWYIMKSAPDAKIYCGLKDEITAEQYEEMVENDTICNALAQYEVSEGDVFYIPAGRIHSIGAGCLIAEIQQTCDLTYRIYDFKRRDLNGNYRQLHTEKAKDSIDFHVEADYHTYYNKTKNEPAELISNQIFTTAFYDLDEPMTLDYSELDSFVILICVDGEGTITDDEGNVEPLRCGDSILIPASTRRINTNGTLRLLEAYV